jgi:hypothetical protein
MDCEERSPDAVGQSILYRTHDSGIGNRCIHYLFRLGECGKPSSKYLPSLFSYVFWQVISRFHIIALLVKSTTMKAMLVADNPTDIEPFSTASYSKMISLMESAKMTGTTRSK